ncbi:MAG: hypothetical protein HY364_00870 [Candidatus Aenigmarchaeota archaeon]|nr:hypothetical protein [Candidatus Aenigmarchaeota archaeon]
MAFELLPQEFLNGAGSAFFILASRPETLILLVGFGISALSGFGYELLLHSYIQRMKEKRHFTEIVSRYFLLVVLVHAFTSVYFIIRMSQSLTPGMPDYLLADIGMIFILLVVVATATNNLSIIRSFVDKG